MDTGTTPSASAWQVVNDYPIVYKVVPWVRALTALVALAFAVDMSYQVLILSRTQAFIAVSPFLASVCVLLAALLAYAVVWAFTARITLYADRFEQRKPFIERTLHLCDITGRRYTKGPGAGYPVIVPKGAMSFSIDTSSYGLDERFNRWFLNLKDLG
jgi:hypothetical protein